MFIQECFIRKDEESIRKKLIELGHQEFDVWGYDGSDAIVVFNSRYCTDYRRKYDHPFLRIRLDTVIPSLNRSIDCGTNEELFLALAALRDDSDVNQWFVSDTESFYFNTTDVFNEGMAHYLSYFAHKWHKATPQELIEHFK